MAKRPKTVIWNKKAGTVKFRIIYNPKDNRYFDVNEKIYDFNAAYNNLLISVPIDYIEQLAVVRKRVVAPFDMVYYLDWQVQFKTPYAPIAAYDDSGQATDKDKLGNGLITYYDTNSHVSYYSVSQETYNQLVDIVNKYAVEVNNKNADENKVDDNDVPKF